MKLKHCVITSVDRDDLPDGGADHWKTTIEAVRRLNPSITMEVLIPDFKGNTELVDKIIEAHPDIISHNLETVERLSRQVRIQARYERSLNVLRHIAEQGIRAKSGIMLGLGETEEEIIQTLSDLLRTGCKIVTIGQYLQPEPNCLPVLKYYSENEYVTFAETALKMGFLKAESGRLVRSSYHAETHIG
jgi:lipoic acid synthetase